MELPPFNFPNPLGYFGGVKQVSNFSATGPLIVTVGIKFSTYIMIRFDIRFVLKPPIYMMLFICELILMKLQSRKIKSNEIM